MLNVDKSPKQSEEVVIYQEDRITLLRITTKSSCFEDVLRLRAEHSNDVTDSYDQYASIYILYHRNVPVGTARFLQAHISPLDFEEVLPFTLEPRFRAFITSGSRLVMTQQQRISFSLSSLLLGIAGQDQISRGVRIDLSACQSRLIPYYKRMGHQLLPYPSIVHPRTQATCYLMMLLTTLKQTKLASRYFTHSSDKTENEVIEFLQLITGSQFTSLLYETNRTAI